MRMTADTNLLVRIIVRDDLSQAGIAYGLVSRAERVAISLPCICEVVWVLQSVYGFTADELSVAIRSIIEPANAAVDEMAIEAGLQILSKGGDFADGVIAAVGTKMGADIFVSFDRKAVAQVNEMGLSARNARDLA